MVVYDWRLVLDLNDIEQVYFLVGANEHYKTGVYQIWKRRMAVGRGFVGWA